MKTNKYVEDLRNKSVAELNEELVAAKKELFNLRFQNATNQLDNTSRIKDVSFSWEDALNFDGETGPYVQYTHARACSVLRKAENVTGNITKLTEDAEYRVARVLYDFPAKIVAAMENNEPSVITRYVIDLAREFNRFYHDCQINTDDEDVKQTRLAITLAVKQVLSKGLWLIGLEAPERV